MSPRLAALPLLEGGAVSTSQARLIAMVDRMPAFPQTVGRILEMTARPDCSPKDLVKVVEHDPVMTMKILRLVNSAYFGLTRTIRSINHGVVMVGINTVKNVALSVAAMGMLPRKNQAGFDTNEFLLHSLGVATVARLLAGRIGVGEKSAPDYFVAGLLHDFGKVVLAQFMPEELRRALELAMDGSQSLHLAERTVIASDHAEIGGLLAASWQLSPELVGCIRHHHDLSVNGDWGIMRDCVFAANQIVRSLGFGDSGNRVIESFPPALEERFGHDLPELIETIGDITQELEKAKIFLKL